MHYFAGWGNRRNRDGTPPPVLNPHHRIKRGAASRVCHAPWPRVPRSHENNPSPQLPSPSSLSPGRGKRGRGERARGVATLTRPCEHRGLVGDKRDWKWTSVPEYAGVSGEESVSPSIAGSGDPSVDGSTDRRTVCVSAGCGCQPMRTRASEGRTADLEKQVCATHSSAGCRPALRLQNGKVRQKP